MNFWINCGFLPQCVVVAARSAGSAATALIFMAMMPSLLVSRIWPWIDYEAKLLAKPSTTTKPSCKLCFLLYERFRHKISLFRRWMMMLILRRYHSVPVTRIYITRQQHINKKKDKAYLHSWLLLRIDCWHYMNYWVLMMNPNLFLERLLNL